MSYIGNAKAPLLYATNVRDDITPDGIESTFLLSQEVPGGYENNIVVIRRKLLKDNLVTGTSLLSIDGTAEKITCANAALSASLSVVQAPIPNIYPGDLIEISGASNGANNETFPVTSVLYDGATIEIFLTGNLVTESGGSISLIRDHLGPWEILEAETDYTIGGPPGPTYNKLITLSEVPQEDDVLYVLHRGDATYNFAPSPNSVGPDQLQTNLRNFYVDRYTGDGSTTDFALSQDAVNERSLIITFDGVEVDGDDIDQAFTGDWELSDPETVSFHSAPANGVKIKILHLGFSTVSRRAALSPGQIGAIPPNSITSFHLANLSVTNPKIDDGAVYGSKVAADGLNGSKILLENDGTLRSKKVDTTPTPLLKLNTSDQTVVISPGDILVQRGGTVIIRSDATSLSPETSGSLSLGKSGNKWSNIFSQNAALDIATVTGNLTVGGNILITGLVDGYDISAKFAAIDAALANVTPPGTMTPTGRSSAPSGWLLCQGQEVAIATYPDLYTALGGALSPFNIGSEAPGNFRIPDLRGRFVLGKTASGLGSSIAEVGGTLSHTHTIGNHTHDLSNHFHNLPAHWHGMGSGADLNITLSGNHTTDIGHTHGAMSTGAETGHTHTFYHTHGISGIGDAIPNNKTSRATTDIAIVAVGDHNHSSSSANNSSIGAYTHAGVVTTLIGHATGGTLAGAGQLMTGNAGGHTHTITEPSGGLGHRHDVKINDFGVSLGDRTTSGSSGHTHNISSFSHAGNSSSTGGHTHPSGNFAGRIGLVTGGVDGNSTMLSGVPSTNLTGSSGAGSTSAENPPFIALNWQIKT